MSSMSIDHSISQNQSINTSIDHQTNSMASQGAQHHNRSITLALKLENEKIQLEKYKKLVQRQLSKQHSIESISIEPGQQNEKLIKISFEPKQNQSTKSEAKAVSPPALSQRVSHISELISKMEGMALEQGKQCEKLGTFLKQQGDDQE